MNVDTTKQPIFLGEPLGLQRYDRYRYPVFMDLFNKQIMFFWRPEEINLMLDRGQFQELSKHEQFIFTKNLLFQTMLDSVVSRGVPTFTKHVSLPEVELCFNTWSFFESIHSYSYSYIIQNVYSNPTNILDQALEDKEILARADSVTRAYEDLANSSMNLKEKIYLSLISVNILEAIRFYVSFVCAFAFAENKKMIGNADVIKLIKRDEACVDEETEVLTPNGWERISHITDDTYVAQYDSNKKISFVKPNKIIKKDYNGKLLSFKSKNSHVDMLLTPDHRIIYENKEKKLVEKSAEDFNCGGWNSIPVAGKSILPNSPLSDYERFLIALQADGSITDMVLRNGKYTGCHTAIFKFVKQRKIDRLISILGRLGFEHSISDKDNRGQVAIYVKIPNDLVLSKLFKDWVPPIDKINYQWGQEFIGELVQWDGHIRKDTGGLYYSSVIEENVTIAQIIACLSGYKSHKYYQDDNRKDSYKRVHRLSISVNKDTHSSQTFTKTEIDHNDKVYCVSVPSGMFLARRNGGIFITGNCHLTITQTLLKILKDEPSEGFQEVIRSKQSEAIAMFAEAAEEEKKWASYLFQYGSMMGLNAEILHRYIEWLTDSRLTALGFSKMFGTKNPIMGWTEPYFNSQAVQPAPQETDITSYVKNSTINDIEDMDFGDWTQ